MMEKQMPRRRRRKSLRGWWRVVPFLGVVGVTLFTFVWLETHRLHNEYRAIELTREIARLNDSLEELRGERHHLGRMERMDEAAPDLALVEPVPGQIHVIVADAEALRAKKLASSVEISKRATRSAYLILEAPVRKRSSTNDSAMARRPAPTDSGTRF